MLAVISQQSNNEWLFYYNLIMIIMKIQGKPARLHRIFLYQGMMRDYIL